MDTIFGLTRINMHKVEKTLDANKQCTPTSKIDKAFSVTKNGIKINASIVDNIATITDATLSAGDTVDLWSWCVQSTENGGICDALYDQSLEDKWQDYLDAQ